MGLTECMKCTTNLSIAIIKIVSSTEGVFLPGRVPSTFIIHFKSKLL